MIDERIVAAAQEFHKLGGCKIVKRMSDFEVHKWFLDLKNNNPFPGEWYDNYKDRGDCIPILDESELWAWLVKHTLSIEVDGMEVSIISSGGNLNRIKITNLHAALYAAAVWVAKEKHEL